jgi:hypothetical protein
LRSDRTELLCPVASADAALLDPDTLLLIVGQDNGEVVAHTVTVGSDQTDPTQRWRMVAHESPVTAVRIGPGFVVTAAADRTVKLFPMHDATIAGDPLRLHRSVRCDGMLIDGVRGLRERELLTALLKGNAAEPGP